MTWALVIEGFLLVLAGIHIVSTGFLVEDARSELESTRRRLRELEDDVRRGFLN